MKGGGKIGQGKEKRERNKVLGRLLLYLDKDESVGWIDKHRS